MSGRRGNAKEADRLALAGVAVPDIARWLGESRGVVRDMIAQGRAARCAGTATGAALPWGVASRGRVGDWDGAGA